MSWTYACPHCRAMLNPDETVIVVAERDGARMLVGFHPEPGNYRVYLPPGVALVPGERCSLSCPACGASLTTEVSEDLCALDVVSSGDVHRVYFSRVVGEQATFVVTAEGLLRDFGVHRDTYVEELVQRIFTR